MKKCLLDLDEKLDLIEKQPTLRLIIRAYIELSHEEPQYPKAYLRRILKGYKGYAKLNNEQLDGLWELYDALHTEMRMDMIIMGRSRG